MNEQTSESGLIDLAANIVSAYVSNNSVRPGDLPGLIAEVHRALSASRERLVVVEPVPLVPKVNPKRSVFPDYIICLDDGKRFKSMKRHLRSKYDLSPEQYREKWGLPKDYPMVAPNYAATRSALARDGGLGQKNAGWGRKRKSVQASS